MRIKFSEGVGEIENLPGCSQVAVFHSVFVPVENRGRGEGSKGHQKRLEYARELLYNYAICTVDSTNLREVAILEKFGWKKLDCFNSFKTGHNVALYGKHLNE